MDKIPLIISIGTISLVGLLLFLWHSNSNPKNPDEAIWVLSIIFGVIVISIFVIIARTIVATTEKQPNQQGFKTHHKKTKPKKTFGGIQKLLNKHSKK